MSSCTKRLSAAGSGETKLARRNVTLLLCEDGLELERADLTGAAQAEVAGGNPLGEEARFRQPERYVADFDTLKDLVIEPLIEEVDVVCSGEFAVLVVIDADDHTVGNRAAHLDAELEVGLQLWEYARVAPELDAGVARPEPRPVASELAPPADPDVEIGELRYEPWNLLSCLLSRVRGGRRGLGEKRDIDVFCGFSRVGCRAGSRNPRESRSPLTEQ